MVCPVNFCHVQAGTHGGTLGNGDTLRDTLLELGRDGDMARVNM